MKSYAQRMKKPQIANLQQSTAATAQISNQAMLGMLNEPDGDTRFSEALRAKFAPKRVPDAGGGKPLPDALCKKYEEKSGLPMDDVRVYYNSDEPAQFDADAFAYGSKVYIAPGKEALMDHEMAHVAQQKMGQIAATDSVDGVPINRSEEFENDADRFAIQRNVRFNRIMNPVIQCARTGGSNKRPDAAKTKAPKRPHFASKVKKTYNSSRKAGTSIDHIISYENIRAVTEAIAKHAKKKTRGFDAGSHLRRLVKAVMPIRNGHKTDKADQKAMLEYVETNAQDIIDQDSVQQKFVSDLNSSLSNLRSGNASINSAIGKRLDPIEGTFSMAQRKGKPPVVVFDNTALRSTKEPFVRIKSLHKLARLKEELGDDLFYKPAVATITGTGAFPKQMVMSSDYSRTQIPRGSKLTEPKVMISHKKKGKNGSCGKTVKHYIK